MRTSTLLCALLLGACGIPDEGPMMRPGENCQSCHGPGADRHWYAAGTVFADRQAPSSEGIQGAEVVIIDAKDRKITLKTNGAGNFYTAETLVFPAKSVEVRRNGKSIKMEDLTDQPPQGSCNSCHTGAAIGRIYAP